MPSIGKISSGQLPKATEWNAIADQFNSGTFGTSGPPGSPSPQQVGIVTVKNISGSDRERFDCMALGDTVFVIGDEAEEDVIFEADTADPDGTPCILQEPIADGQLGRAVIFGYTLAKFARADNVGDLWGMPNATNHNLDCTGGGPVYLISPPSDSAASVRPCIVNPTETLAVFRTPTGGISAISGSTLGDADCDHVTVTGGTRRLTGSSSNVKNVFGSDIAEATDIIAARIGGIWIVISEDCSGA